MLSFNGWWFGTFFIFHNIWDVILPIDELIFFRGVGIAPTNSGSGKPVIPVISLCMNHQLLVGQVVLGSHHPGISRVPVAVISLIFRCFSDGYKMLNS